MTAMLFEHLGVVAAFFDNELLLAAFLFIGTACIVGLCVPGLLVPISFSAGMLMDSWLAVPVVVTGAVLGSQALFLAARHGLGGRLERRFAARMGRLNPRLQQYGPAAVTLLRVIGTPHFLVTLASAAGPLGQRGFAIASLLGFLPAIAVSAVAGAAL